MKVIAPHKHTDVFVYSPGRTLVLDCEVGGDQGGNLTPDVGSVDLSSSLGLIVLDDLRLKGIVSFIIYRTGIGSIQQCSELSTDCLFR